MDNKIQLELSLNLTEETKEFFRSLFAGAHQPAQRVAHEEISTPAQTKPVKATATITIDSLRAAVAPKIETHRDEIKAKLQEMGAPSISKLDPAKYEEFHDFIDSL